MANFRYTIKAAEGLHARPAGMLVKYAQNCTSNIKMETRGKTADAKRLFAVLGLGAMQDDEVAFTLEGPKEKEDCEKLKAFCEANL